jgi:nucleoid-associated protein YgaU
MSLVLFKNDLYANGTKTVVKDEPTTMRRENRTYVPSKNDKVHTSIQGENWQDISFKYYKTAKLYHYLMDINKVFNPFDTIVAGSSIIIPDIENY